MPFSEAIDAPAEQMINYLVNNPAHIVYDEESLVAVTNPSTHAAQCITETDALVVNETLLQIADYAEMQFIASEEAISYHVPLRSERRNGMRCRSVRSFF